MSLPPEIPTTGAMRDTIEALTPRQAKLALHYLSGYAPHDLLRALLNVRERDEERQAYLDSLSDR